MDNVSDTQDGLNSTSPVPEQADSEWDNQRQYFQHTALNHKKASIRLLQILPELSSHDLIQIRLQHYELPIKNCNYDGETPSTTENAGLEYSCLSYTWGDGLKDRLIIINEQPYLVHQNLWDFLNSARKSFERDGGLRCPPEAARNSSETIRNPLIWIDAICIDQVNVTEKNHQVQQMGRIYANAKLVLIWIGNGCEDLLRQLFNTDSRHQLFRLAEKRPEIFLVHKIHSITKSKYWSRAWITQEVVLARQSAIFLASGTYDLRSSLDLVEEASLRAPNSWASTGDSFRRLSEYVRTGNISELQKSPLHALNRFGATKGCADARDRVYSILGLCRPNNGIQVDYAIPREQIMRQVLASCSSHCFCDIATVAKALELGPTQHADGGFSITTHGVASQKFTSCSDCHVQRPVSGRDSLCMRHICGSMRGHIFAPIPRAEHSDDASSRQADYAYNNVELIRIWGVQTSQYLPKHTSKGRTKNAPLRRWTFSSGALISIAWYANERGQTCVRLCHPLDSENDRTNSEMTFYTEKEEPALSGEVAQAEEMVLVENPATDRSSLTLPKNVPVSASLEQPTKTRHRLLGCFPRIRKG